MTEADVRAAVQKMREADNSCDFCSRPMENFLVIRWGHQAGMRRACGTCTKLFEKNNQEAQDG